MPESERAKIAWPQESILSRQCFDVDCANCDNKNRDGKPCEHYCHATLTCSEVVERLAKECLSANPNPVATIASARSTELKLPRFSIPGESAGYRN
jgi:hypothetical protein